MEFNKCKVGELVQIDNRDNNPRDGVISALIPAKKERPTKYWEAPKEDYELWKTFITVKFEDGQEETFDSYSVSPRDSELERTFRTVAGPVMAQINAKLDEANAALSEAEKIADEHGIPFYAGISPLSQGYTPESFQEKYGEVDNDIVSDVTGCGDNSDAGWKHSAVCY